MKKSQGRRKGPRLPGTLLKELGSLSGGGKGPGHRQTWKRTNEVKRRREDVGKPKKKRLSGSKFDELVPQSATAMGESDPSVSECDLSVSLEEENSDDIEGGHESADVSIKYVPPALRKRTGEVENILNTTNEQEMAVRKRVRGLINRVAEANLEGIVSELSDMYKNEGRTYVSQSLSHELITAATDGPRASERFAIVAATCVASVAASTESSEVIATFLSHVGMALEKSLSSQDSLSCSNLVRLLGCLFLAKAIKPDIMFDVLDSWGEAFSDEHVVSIAGLLTVAGLALRKADPSQMKNFVVNIHEKASNRGTITTRARVMLDLVVDNVDAVAVGGISWNKIIDPHSKKGFWWIPTLQDTIGKHQETRDAEVTQGNDARDDLASNNDGDASLLALASKLRMSTDTRKSIFLAVMGGEDAIDAAEKLLRLNLKGQQEREIVRVTVECSLHENAWNPYYGLLLSRLCQLAKGHRVTLQYCIWDHVKDCDRMNARKIAIFSKLAAFVVTSKTLPLASIVKVSSLSSSEMDAKELLLWRLFFKSTLEGFTSDDEMRAVFIKLVEQKEQAPVKRQVRNFLRTRIGPWLATKNNVSLAITRCNKAERYLTK
eukprot:jgi/Picre1/27805/NNA_000769.t1